MTNAKMTGIPLVTENRKSTELLSRQITEYAKDATTSNLIYPKFVFAGKGINDTSNTLSEKKVTYDKYDLKGNLQQYTLENGTSVTILWGYSKTLPIAKIENASYSQVAAALGVTNAVLDTYNETNLAVINALRSNANLVNSPINTYTYRPLIGVSTITDLKGDIITYTYDALGRLINVRDKDNNILSENKYQYQN
jgi:YD repeat-containing protein